MSTLLLPNAELVARAWLLAALPTTLAAGQVATTLPEPPWIGDQFVQIMQVGGGVDPENFVGEPVVSINCFAMVPNSRKPPWGKAAQMAMQIWRASLIKRWQPDPAVELVMPTGYGRAICRTVTAVGDPKRIPSDPSQYAVYSLDLMFSWIPASEVL